MLPTGFCTFHFGLFLYFFSFLFFFFCFVSFLTILFSFFFFAFRFFFRFFSLLFSLFSFRFFFLSVSFRFFPFLSLQVPPSPSYLHQLFPTTYSTSRVLRSNTQDNLNIPRPNTEKFKHSFQYSGARLWNDLPANIRNSNSLYSFKNSMLKHIKSKRDTH